jgi:hypothetical protein
LFDYLSFYRGKCHEKYNDENYDLTERKNLSVSLRALMERPKIDLDSTLNLLIGKKIVKTQV